MRNSDGNSYRSVDWNSNRLGNTNRNWMGNWHSYRLWYANRNWTVDWNSYRAVYWNGHRTIYRVRNWTIHWYVHSNRNSDGNRSVDWNRNWVWNWDPDVPGDGGLGVGVGMGGSSQVDSCRSNGYGTGCETDGSDGTERGKTGGSDQAGSMDAKTEETSFVDFFVFRGCLLLVGDNDGD